MELTHEVTEAKSNRMPSPSWRRKKSGDVNSSPRGEKARCFTLTVRGREREFSLFYSGQRALQHWGRQSALCRLPIQKLISSKKTLRDTLEIIFN